MRTLFLFSLLILTLSACAAPAQDDVALREKQKNQAFSDNMKQDGKELSEQVKKDFAVLGDQVSEDADQAGDNVGRNANRVANNVRDRIKITGRKMREWWLTPPPNPQPHAVASSYCYHVLQDIVCYRQPVAGWEHRLAGYQGTGAEPPPPSVTQPLPKRTADNKNQPANRLATAQPVFVNLPPDEKKTSAPVNPTTIDTSNGNLPNPTLAPQL